MLGRFEREDQPGGPKAIGQSRGKWIAFFERNVQKTGVKDPVAAYEWLMKYGLSRQQMKYRRPGMHYWNEYVFGGYVSHQSDMIILAGYPDIPLSRPHSEESQALLQAYQAPECP